MYRVYKVNNSIVHAESSKIRNRTKKCNKCLEWYDLDFFYIKNINGTNYFRPYCKSCESEIKLNYWKCRGRREQKYRKTKRDESGIIMLQCNRCGVFKYKVDFWRNSASRFKRRSSCIDCLRKIS